MADIDKMFHSELAVLADQPSESDLWTIDPRTSSQLVSVLGSPAPFDAVAAFDAGLANALATGPATPRADTTLGLFPTPDHHLPIAPTQQADPLHVPFTAHLHQPQTVHLSDVSLGTVAPISLPMPAPIHHGPPVQISMSASSSGAYLTDSPTDSHMLMGSSSEDMDSDDFDFACPSDPEFFPSPVHVSVNPATLSMAGMNPHAMHTVRPSRRASRAMTNIPVPIPNLTKKSRGRKVPTSNGEPIYASSRDKTKRGIRTYTCSADGCNKCFVRGEHLKRHIRSIHTDERPWTCNYENCDRTFSRRDNLNQHLRVHKLQDGDD